MLAAKKKSIESEKIKVRDVRVYARFLRISVTWVDSVLFYVDLNGIGMCSLSKRIGFYFENTSDGLVCTIFRIQFNLR